MAESAQVALSDRKAISGHCIGFICCTKTHRGVT